MSVSSRGRSVTPAPGVEEKPFKSLSERASISAWQLNSPTHKGGFSRGTGSISAAFWWLPREAFPLSHLQVGSWVEYSKHYTGPAQSYEFLQVRSYRKGCGLNEQLVTATSEEKDSWSKACAVEQAAVVSLAVEVVGRHYTELQLLWKAERLWELWTGALPLLVSVMEKCTGFGQMEKNCCDKQVTTVCQHCCCPAHPHYQSQDQPQKLSEACPSCFSSLVMALCLPLVQS